MTTRVTIANHGPDSIVVVTAHGIGLGIPDMKPKYDDCVKVEIAPGQHRDLYVHSSQSLMVLEKERPIERAPAVNAEGSES